MISFPPIRSLRRSQLVLASTLLASSAALAGDLFVNNEDPTCLGEAPCFTTIQEAVDRAVAGDQVRIQPGVYTERLVIRDKNYARSTPGERIVIGRDEAAPLDSVVLDGRGLGGGCAVGAIEINDSAAITLRGFVITGFAGPSIELRGGPHDNRAIHIERNRIFDNGRGHCSGGVVIEKGNPDTLVVNNLIYANRGSGIELSALPGRGRGAPEETRERVRNGRGIAQGLRTGGPHYLIQNTIHGNGVHGIAIALGQRAILANNAVTGNGDRPRGGFGIYREEARDPRASEISLLNNLLCGNAAGEAGGALFVGENLDNLTPTDPRERLPLGCEAGGDRGRVPPGLDHPQRHGAADRLRLLGEPDLAHPPFADRLDQPVAINARARGERAPGICGFRKREGLVVSHGPIIPVCDPPNPEDRNGLPDYSGLSEFHAPTEGREPQKLVDLQGTWPYRSGRLGGTNPQPNSVKGGQECSESMDCLDWL
jgi:hypothetical protein